MVKIGLDPTETFFVVVVIIVSVIVMVQLVVVDYMIFLWLAHFDSNGWGGLQSHFHVRPKFG